MPILPTNEYVELRDEHHYYVAGQSASMCLSTSFAG
jgi:hypothetical protein